MRDRCQAVLEALRAVVPFHMATVWADAAGRLTPAAAVGGRVDLLETVPFDGGWGLRTWVLHTGRVVRIPSRGRGFRDSALRGFLALPVEREGLRLGVLVLARTDREFTEQEVSYAQEAAGLLARALAEAKTGA